MTLAAGGLLSLGGATATSLENLYINNSVVGKEQGKDDLTLNDIASLNNSNAPVLLNPNGSTVIGGTAPYTFAPAKNTLWGSTDIRAGASEAITIKGDGQVSILGGDNTVEMGADTGVSITPGAGALNIQLSAASNSSGVVISDIASNQPQFSSAVLDVMSDDRGVYIPRLTSAQRSAIANPQNGLLCYDTTVGSLAMYGPRGWAKVALAAIETALGAEAPSHLEELQQQVQRLEAAVRLMDGFLKVIDEGLAFEGWAGYPGVSL